MDAGPDATLSLMPVNDDTDEWRSFLHLLFALLIHMDDEMHAQAGNPNGLN